MQFDVKGLSAELLNQAVLTVQYFLTNFAFSEDFFAKLTIAFGSPFNTEKAEELRQHWANGNFEALPRIEVLPASEINGASGAFARGTNTIYLAEECIADNASNLQAVTAVLLEEIGHFVDAQINSSDAPGDEGAIFSALVRGETLNEQQMQLLKAEDDSATISLDGQTVQIEQALIQGQGGDEVLTGGADPDTIDGGAGNDTASYLTSTAAVNVSLVTGTGLGGYAQGDVLISIENLEGSQHRDTLVGNSLDNTLSGLGNNDSLIGGDGNDVLIGGAGADTLNGGNGSDTASYSTSTAGVNVSLATGTGSGGDAQGDRLSSIENIVGSSSADSLVGNSANNVITPGLGVDDNVDGGAGNDLLILNYSVGDTGTGIIGNNGIQVYRYTSDNSNSLDWLTYYNIERFQFTGTSKNDTFSSYTGNDLLDGGAGDDVLDAGSGNDTINGGAGDDSVSVALGENSVDKLDGGAGTDTLSADLSNQTASIQLDSTNPVAELNFANGTRIANFEAFQKIRTGSGNDLLVQQGGIDNDFRTGAGNDTINAGLGYDDNVDGGEGNDLLILDYSVGDTGTGIIGTK